MNIIDIILDRRDGLKYTKSAEKNIVTLALRNDLIGIYTAFAVGDELDVQDALCDYIDRCGFNPELKWYIRSNDWQLS